ncbi:MAG: HNH endonuclease [SAR324 cluster bacterium]|nr:HNH endonuclease [SAR324 cluster bacterium]
MTDIEFQIEVDEDRIRGEKAKARKLRNTQWWKNKRASGLCQYCRERFPVRELTMDHVVPLVRGGRSIKSNLVPCCRPCNDRKKYLLPVEWQSYLDSLAVETPALETPAQ